MITLQPLVIDRKTWLRGRGSEVSFLRNDAGEMCCLGSACLASGLDEWNIVGLRVPSEIRDVDIPKWAKGLVASSLELGEPMSVNDDVGMSDSEREEKLVPLLARLGFAVTFVD